MPLDERHKRLAPLVVGAFSFVGASLAGVVTEKTIQKIIQHYESGVTSKQCSLTITHKGYNTYLNAFTTHFITEDEGDNRNYEQLDGLDEQTDVTKEDISSESYLKIIKMRAHGKPCVAAITILCGDQTIRGDGGITITAKDMKAAGDRKYLGLNYDSNTPACIQFDTLKNATRLRYVH